MKQQFIKGKTGTIRLSVYEKNVQISPSSATIVLKKPGGDTLQASASATVDGTTGELTYSITATHTATNDLNYIAEWTYTIGGEDYYTTQLFDVVLSKLAIPITDNDLFNELDSLREVSEQDSSTATGGASGTIIDTAQRKEADDYWNGGTVTILSGTGVNQVRDITDFVQSTSTISVSPNWVTTPDTTSVYLVKRGFSNKISQSFKKIETELYNKGKRHSLIIESSQIEVPMIYLTVANICTDLISDDGDKWSILADKYMEKYEKAFTNMRVDYDLDESGTIDGVEEMYNTGEIRVLRS